MTITKRRSHLSRALALAALVTAVGTAAGQAAPEGIGYQRLPLDRPGALPATGANWGVVGAVEALPGQPLRLQSQPGSGVLVNHPSAAANAHFTTDWEHGDIELELDFLVPQGSNSGVYLQGRYEVQILDSWGVRRPTFADAGGIYERWHDGRPEAEAGYEGHPPLLNASRAPGLWQHLAILFRAPRFDAQGRKVANARFVRVEHNGVVVHENVEVTGPTRSASFADERATGPLVLQGDHGPVAFRDIRYKRYSGERLTLSNLRYRTYRGEFAGLAAATAGTPHGEGVAERISTRVAEEGDRFAIAYEGVMEVPKPGTHSFELSFEWVTPDPGFTGRVVGGGRLAIDGQEVLVHGGLQPSATGQVQLTAGRHPFTLTMYKNRPWIDQMKSVSLWVEGPGIERHPLHEIGPVAVAEAITVEPGSTPVVLRSFVEHGGQVLTHALSIGDPAEVHYGYDAQRGALLHAWRGPFVETTEMWHDRGERQVARPRGSVLSLPRAPTVAALADASAAWPDSLIGEAYRFRGYVLDADGRPTFQYHLGAMEVEDRIRPGTAGTSLRRELAFRGREAPSGSYVRVAAGAGIRRLRDGSYVVGDLAYYIVLDDDAPRPVLRRSGDRDELLLPVQLRDGAARVSYSILW